jgi:transposase-like protein
MGISPNGEGSGNSTKDMNEKEKLEEESGAKQELVGLMQSEQYSLYEAAAKLGIARQQVSRWLFRDREFRLMIRAARVTQTAEFLSRAIELRQRKQAGQSLNAGEKVILSLATETCRIPGVLEFLLDPRDPAEISKPELDKLHAK